MPGRAGAGMLHTLVWRVGSEAALDFWAERLQGEGVTVALEGNRLRFADPEGLGLELANVDSGDAPLRAAAPDIPAAHALLGFDGEARGSRWSYDAPPPERGIQGAGTVHHIAWASPDADHEAWRRSVSAAGAHVTPIIDRQYFFSIYFREPSGVLFEIATLGPGFATDEDPAHLGEALRLPPQHEHLREQLERSLTPLQNPRVSEVTP